MSQIDEPSMEQMEQPPMEEQENPFSWKLLKRIFSYMKGRYLILFAIVLAGISIGQIVSVYGTTFLTDLFREYIEPFKEVAETSGLSAVDYTPLVYKLVLVGLIFLFGVAAQAVSGWLVPVISSRVLHDVREDMFKHMQKLPVSFFDEHVHGEVMSYYTNDVETLRGLISSELPAVVGLVIAIVSNFVGMIVLSWQLTIIVVVAAVILCFSVGKIGSLGAKYFMQQMMSLGEVNGYIEEMVNGQKVVKVFNYEKRAKKEFDQKNEDLRQKTTKAGIVASILAPITGGVGKIVYILVALIGGFLAIECGVSAIDAAVIISFLRLAMAFVEPVSQVAQVFSSLLMAMAGSKRVFDFLDEEPEKDEGYVTLVHAKYEGVELVEVSEEEARANKHNEDYVWAWKHPHSDGTITFTQLRGDVVMLDVDFSYDGKKQVLYGISLYANRGQKVAFVGSTGAGKTTITNLINRFYAIEDGKIRYDDININKIRKPDLRRSLGVVLQETNLFTGTVMENIRYGNLEATDEECIAAAKLANAHDFISKLPQGYDTLLTSNGTELSQGQRQLIAIARAAVADPPIMILDEATSSIDTRTEAIVQRGMDALMKNRTVLVIAHRLSTVRNSDDITVMENGHIIERGDHESLIAMKGKYYQLYTGATELE